MCGFVFEIIDLGKTQDLDIDFILPSDIDMIAKIRFVVYTVLKNVLR